MIMECQREEKFHSYLSQTSLEHEKHCLRDGFGRVENKIQSHEFFLIFKEILKQINQRK